MSGGSGDYWMNETLFNELRGIFCMPSCTDMAGHTKAFDYPVTQTLLDISRPLRGVSRLFHVALSLIHNAK